MSFVALDSEIISEIAISGVQFDGGVHRTTVCRETLVFFGYTTAWEVLTDMEFYFLACEYLFAHCETFISSDNAEISEVWFRCVPA